MPAYHKPFDLDDDPRVPKQVRWNLQRILRGARDVVVMEVTGTSTKKINGIKLRTKTAPGTMPDENLDEIAEHVCKIMHYGWVQKNLNAEDGEIVAITCRIQAKVDAPLKNQPKTPSFDWPYDPEGMMSEVDEIGELEKTTLMHLLESIERSRETDRFHIESMQDRFLTLAEHMAGPLASVSDILQYAGGLSLQGTQALVQALQMTHSVETAKEIEAEKTKRSEMMWGRIGGWLDLGVKAAGEQVADYFGKKRRGGAPRPGGQPRRPRPDARPGPDASEDPRAQQQQERPDAQEPEPPLETDDDEDEGGLTEEEMANPIALLCRTFGDMLNGSQHRDLDAMFTKREKAMFNDLFCAENDNDAIEHWLRLEDVLPVEKLLRLNGLLTDDQREIFVRVKELVARANEEEEEEEVDDDADSEDDPEDDGGDDE